MIRNQIRFLEKPDATSLIPANQLQKIFGGEINLEYDHASYFPALTKLCLERKAANLERWRQYGNDRCGLDEAVIRGAYVPGEKHDPTKGVAEREADVEGRSSAPPSAAASVSNLSATAVTAADDEEVPTEQLAQSSLRDETENEIASTSSSSEATAVSTPAPPLVRNSTEGGEDKFVEAPLASATAVEQAVPAIH